MRILTIDTVNPRNPFKRVRYIPLVPEIVKIAHSRSKKAKPKKIKKKLSREEKIALVEETRIVTFTQEVISRLKDIIKQFPSLETIHPFYQELMELVCSIDRVKQILGRLEGIARQVAELEKTLLEKLGAAQTPPEFAQIRREAIGRVISLISKAKGDVKYLTRIIKQLKDIPDFNMLLPTVVIAGAPNVGKSSLVRAISTGTPEIGAFPFTTKNIVFGHRDFRFLQIQIVDTPGILDRPFSSRSVVELKSIVAIKNIADIIVFMFDGSDKASLSADEQLSLLHDIEQVFTKGQIIKVLNKIDLLDTNKRRYFQDIFKAKFLVSTKTMEGLEALTTEIEKIVQEIIQSSPKFEYLGKLEIAEEFKSEPDESFLYHY